MNDLVTLSLQLTLSVSHRSVNVVFVKSLLGYEYWMTQFEIIQEV